jgi:hypothetical protein
VRAILLHQIHTKILKRRLATSPGGADRAFYLSEEDKAATAVFNFVSGDMHFLSSVSGVLYLL